VRNAIFQLVTEKLIIGKPEDISDDAGGHDATPVLPCEKSRV